MGIKRLSLFLTIVFVLGTLITAQAEEAQKMITENELGTHDGYDYELWKDSGATSMTINNGGAFSCSWSDINNALFRTGMKFDQTKTYEELGNIVITYDCDYQPNGNSYLSVYGWTTGPLVEYYIVDSWGSWRPPGATSKGTITVDGGTYEIYETTRTEQPSIQGTATFQQYWSVRTSKRTSGSISVSEHFKAWESMGMEMGKMYEASLLVEGYQSSGTADVKSNNITIGGSITSQAIVVPADLSAKEPEKGTAAFGTPEMNGNKDDIWDRAESLPISKMLQEPDAASGTARVLWDEDNLYVLFEVSDNNLNNTSATVHEQDSVEAFVDEKNCKNGAYQNDDGQYRVCYDNSLSFGSSTNKEGFDSVSEATETGYIVEMKIPFKAVKPSVGMEIGFDAQINDGKDGTRVGIAKWSDNSDNSWQDTSGWGIVTLLASGNDEPSGDAPDNDEPSGDAPVNGESSGDAPDNDEPSGDASVNGESSGDGNDIPEADISTPAEDETAADNGNSNNLTLWAVLAVIIAGIGVTVFSVRMRK